MKMALRAEPLSRASVAGDSLAILDSLFAHFPRPDFQVRLWDGTIWGATTNPRFAIVLKHPAALRQMFQLPSEASLGEAYIRDDFDLEGDVEAAMTVADALVHSDFALPEKLRLAVLLRELPAPRHGLHPARLFGSPHSEHRDKQAIAYHYNLPTEFYSLFLDKRLVYSCAYFEHPDDDLDTAQFQKLDYLCRKLRLQPGDRLLDFGCGWGALVIHAAKHCGVDAHGITLSEPQAQEARRRIAEAGLTDRCKVEVRDYRALGERERYNKIVSVGMFEHVGEKMLPEYFSRAYQLLEPGGVFLNHGIARSAKWKRKGESFSDLYVFPDGELVPLNITTRVAEEAGFEVRDVESLREHYALTLRHWIRRLEQNHERAKLVADEKTYRTWRLYMAGSAHRFAVARLNLYQVLMAKPENGKLGLPLTRKGWYCVQQ